MNYKIIVENQENTTIVSKCLDPLFDAKLLLEGIGVLISEISKWTKGHPQELKQENWDMEKEDILKFLHHYLDIVGKDYKQTEKVISIPIK